MNDIIINDGQILVNRNNNDILLKTSEFPELISSDNLIEKNAPYVDYSNIFEITGDFYQTRRQIQYLKNLKYNFKSEYCARLPPPCPCLIEPSKNTKNTIKKARLRLFKKETKFKKNKDKC